MKISFLFVTFILLLILNAFIFINRNDFLYTKQVSYSELYPAASSFTIKEITSSNDSCLQLTLADTQHTPVDWSVNVNGKTFSYKGVHPFLPLQKGLHYYKVFAKDIADTLTASVEFKPATPGTPKFIGLYRTNAVMHSANTPDLHTPVFSTLTPEEEKEVDRLLKDSVGVLPAMSSDAKTLLICRWLFTKLYQSRGEPTNEMLARDPYGAYLQACKGEKIWCGIYTEIFNLFASRAGIRSRTIEIRQEFPGVYGAVHEFNEYFSNEEKQWAALDLMFNHINYRNAAGKLLTGVEVKNTLPEDSTVKITKADSSGLTTSTFDQAEKFFFDLYGREKDLHIYRFTASAYHGSLKNRLINYVYPRYWFTFYSDTQIVSNRNFYIKQMAVFLFLIVTLLMAFNLIGQYYKKRKG